MRVFNDQGFEGTIDSVNGHIAEVKWDTGHVSKVPTDTIYQTGGSKLWTAYLILSLALGLIIAVGLWLSTAG